MARAFYILCLAAAVLYLFWIWAGAGCDWVQIDSASIQISAIPGGYRAIFDGGNCSYSAEGPEVLPALDALLASLWCDWSANKEVY